MWFKAFIAWFGIIWEIVECAACQIQVAIRKGQVAPPGWIAKASKLFCPKCSDKECEL